MSIRFGECVRSRRFSSLAVGITAVLALGSGAGLAQDTDISVVGGQMGGAYNRVSTAVAAYMSENVEGIRASSEATTGSPDNLRRLHTAEVEFGPAFANNIFDAYRGKEIFDEPMENLRAVATIFSSVGHFVVPADSPIQVLDDIRGRTISLGGPGSGSATNITLLLEHVGLWGEFTPAFSGSKSPAELANGKVEAYNWHPGLGNSMIQDTAANMEIRFIDLNEPAEASGFYEAFPYFVPMTIPAGVYPGVDVDTQTIGTGTVMMTHAGVPDDIVQKLLDSLYSDEGKAYLISAAGGVMKETTYENAFRTITVPLHPGAVKYFEDNGVAVPEELIAR